MAEKKRYHQSPKAKMHERRGEERHMARKKMSEGDYAGAEPRRRQEMEDAGMIRESHHEVANMPQEVMYKPWPKAGHYLDGELNDTISGIDRQMDEDGRDAKKHRGVHKW